MSVILLEIHEGQVVRNLFENGLFERLTCCSKIIVITPSARVASFVLRYANRNVEFYDLGLLESVNLTRWENYEFVLGKQLSSHQAHRIRRFLWHYFTEPGLARLAKKEQAFLAAAKPDMVVATHISQTYGRGLVAVANQMGIPTVGNLNSWDNAWKGLKVRPQVVTCWSENNKREICALASYRPQDVKVIGAPAFDAYFASDAQWTRSELCERLHLDATRPILLFATLGQFKQQIDETNPLEVLVRAVDDHQIPGNPQVVVRLHPWSRETYFSALLKHPQVTVSRYENYVPGLTWTPTRDEAILAGNLLRHADVVISPGSTMVVEAAIFDTPVVVPVFNEYMPEVFENYFRQTWLNQHFGRIYQNDWVYIAKQPEQMIAAVNSGLNQPDWYQQGRLKIRENILGPLDGKAVERFAEIIFSHLK